MHFLPKKLHQKLTPLLILIILPLVSFIISLLTAPNFLFATLLFYLPPCIYLIFFNKKKILKSAIFALLFSIPLTLIFDYLISIDEGWHINSSMINFRIFNIVALEQFPWAFLWVLFIVLFYEYFLDKKERWSWLPKFLKKNKLISKPMIGFSILLFVVLAIVISLALVKPSLLHISYSYLILSIIFGVIPLTIFLYWFPNFLTRFAKLVLYFGAFAVLVEYVGLKLNHWSFPGSHYLGLVPFFGFIIPLEEVFIYFLISTPAILSYYEFFDDDRR